MMAIVVTTPPPPNKAPRANAGTAFNATEGEQFTIRGMGSDDDGYIAIYEWDTDSDGMYDTYSEEDGTLIWSIDEVGDHTLTLRVTDNRGSTDTSSVTAMVGERDGHHGPSPGTSPSTVLFAVVVTVLVLGLAGQRWRQSRK
jgi:hypothetical protein